MSTKQNSTTTRRRLLRRLAGLGAVLGAGGVAHAGGEPVKEKVERVVYHIDNLDHAIPMIRNLSNHLDDRPQAEIQVVAMSSGLKMLVSGNEDENGNDYEALVNDLQRRGVVFKACGNTMDTYHLTPEDLVWDVPVIRSAMAELGRLQAQEGFAYLKV